MRIIITGKSEDKHYRQMQGILQDHSFYPRYQEKEFWVLEYRKQSIKETESNKLKWKLMKALESWIEDI